MLFQKITKLYSVIPFIHILFCFDFFLSLKTESEKFYGKIVTVYNPRLNAGIYSTLKHKHILKGNNGLLKLQCHVKIYT